MRRFILICLAMLLLLAGCYGKDLSETTSGTETNASAIFYENDIGMPPLNFAPFIYTEDSTFDFFRELYDTDDCIPGYLYVYDEHTKESVQITNFPVLDLTETQECIFYVTEDYKIVRTNYTGDYHKVIYTATHGAISKIEYGYGKLTFPDGDHVMVMDLNAGTCQDVFQLEKVESASHCAVGTNLFICAGEDFLGLDYSTGKTCIFPSYQAGFDFISLGIWPEIDEPKTTVLETTILETTAALSNASEEILNERIELNVYYPQEIPDGYNMTFVSDGTPLQMQDIRYENDSGDLITYWVYSVDMASFIEINEVEIETDVIINGIPGILYEHEGNTRTLIWINEDQGYGCAICTKDTAVDLIAMAKSTAEGELLIPTRSAETVKALKELGDFSPEYLPEGHEEVGVQGSPLPADGWYSYVRRWYANKQGTCTASSNRSAVIAADYL